MGFSKSGALVSFLSVAEVAFAITIIVLIAEELLPGAGTVYVCGYDATGQEQCGYFYSDGTCLMTNNSINVCRYGYATAAIGIIVSLVTVFAFCLPGAITALTAAFSSLWWLAYSITATVYSADVHNQSFTLQVGQQQVDIPYSYPRGNYRVMVYALSWTTFACSLVSVPLALAADKSESKEAQPKGEESKDTASKEAVYV